MADQWRQHTITFPDRATAEQVATEHLRPALVAAADAGLLHGWWFVRKPSWKLRYLAEPDAATPIDDLLDTLTGTAVTEWTLGIYEPETLAFGGTEGMAVAHELFHHDSRHVLRRAPGRTTPTPLGACETAAILCQAMLRAAGLDWFEQGDVWAKVAQLRPAPPERPPAAPGAPLAAKMFRLMALDARSLCQPQRNGPLVGYDAWLDAFEHAGQALADLARHGRLQRGLRAVLAHHVIFHANRAGITAADLSTLAACALNTVFAADPTLYLPVLPNGAADVTTPASNNDATADELRGTLADRLRQAGTIHTPGVEAAIRAVPRHLFLPGIGLEQAYADNPVYTKHDAAGASISAASQPAIVATMLEQLAPAPGDRVLEIGAGTGYNAALLATMVGETGRVVAIDVDEDLVDGARKHLVAAEISNVEVVLGDGTLGCAEAAPYDRAIATVGAYEVPTAWLDQLAPHGRLVVPLRLRGTASRSIAFERRDHGWISIDSQLAVFMPLRGIGDDARRIIPLTPEQDVTLQVHADQPVEADALAGIFATDRHKTWTGVTFPANVSFEWLELWLCLRLDNALMRMNVQPAAKDRGQVRPMFGWGSMATAHGRNLAYLTIRTAEPGADSRKMYEVGVIAHGPTSERLAAQVATEIQTWDRDWRTSSVRFTLPNNPGAIDPVTGSFILDRPHRPIVVGWE